MPHETLGTVATALADAGLESRYACLGSDVPPRLPPPNQLAGLVVLGGPMNVDQTDEYPFLEPEVRWIREAIEARLPVLGICLGSQLLAKALGARVRPNPVKEIGWYAVELTSEAAHDRLFAGCGPRMTVFQWHGDTFESPAGAVHLARSDLCENQAFRYGDSAYALQFHVEVTSEMIDDWLSDPGNRDELAQLDYIDPQATREEVPHELPEMQAVGARVFDRFAAICRQRSQQP